MRDLVRRLDNIDRRVREVSRSHHGGGKGTLEERVATAEAAIAKLLDLEEEDATEIERVDAAEQIDAENIEQHTNQLTAHGESIGKHKKQLDTVDAREKADKTELDGKLKTASEQQQKDKTAVDKALKVLDDREAKNHTAQQQTLDKHTTQIDALEKRKPDTSAVEKKLQALDDREKKNNTAVAQSVSDLDKREAKNHTAQNTQLTQQKQTTDALDAREKKNNTALSKTVTDLDKREATDKTELTSKITKLDQRVTELEKRAPAQWREYTPVVMAEKGPQGQRDYACNLGQNATLRGTYRLVRGSHCELRIYIIYGNTPYNMGAGPLKISLPEWIIPGLIPQSLNAQYFGAGGWWNGAALSASDLSWLWLLFPVSNVSGNSGAHMVAAEFGKPGTGIPRVPGEYTQGGRFFISGTLAIK